MKIKAHHVSDRQKNKEKLTKLMFNKRWAYFCRYSFINDKLRITTGNNEYMKTASFINFSFRIGNSSTIFP